MRKLVMKICSLLFIAVMPFSFALYTAEGERADDFEIYTEPSPGFSIPEYPGYEYPTAPQETAPPQETEPPQAPVNAVPTSTAEILALYNKLMNEAKAQRPGFKKYEFQEIPGGPEDRVVRQGSALVSPVLKAVSAYTKTESEAKKSPLIFDKGSDMNEFPLFNNPNGSLLTNLNAIKYASCAALANGNNLITIILHEELSPRATPPDSNTPLSNTGAIFNPPPESEIQKYLEQYSSVVKPEKYTDLFHNCTAELEYNPQTNQIVSLTQRTVTKVDGVGKVMGAAIDFTQNLYYTLRIYDLVY